MLYHKAHSLNLLCTLYHCQCVSGFTKLVFSLYYHNIRNDFNRYSIVIM